MMKYLLALSFAISASIFAEDICQVDEPVCMQECGAVCATICYEPYYYTKPRYTFTTEGEEVSVWHQRRRCRIDPHKCERTYYRHKREYDYSTEPRTRLRHKRRRHCTYEPCIGYRKVYRMESMDGCPPAVCEKE